MTDDKLTAAGGFCAPRDSIYDLHSEYAGRAVDFPRLTVQRGGPNWFPKPGTPEWQQQAAERAARESFQAMVARHIGGILEAQNRVLDGACLEALQRGWDVHVQRPPYHQHGNRFLGIELAERRTGRTFPTLHEHETDDRWDDLDDLD